MNRRSEARESWAVGDAYESFIGRWSRPVGAMFVRWLAMASGLDWLDIGCGTGALIEQIAELVAPRRICGVDRSESFISYCRSGVRDPRPTFTVGSAEELPVESATFDGVVSGLVLNFVPEPIRMIREMARVARPGGTVALYVWDYAGRMELLRYFWDAAAALDPGAAPLDEGIRFPVCAPEQLVGLLVEVGLVEVASTSLEVPTSFRTFDDYWTPFLGGQGPAPGYVATLSERGRLDLRNQLDSIVPKQPDGSIRLIARAQAARGRTRPVVGYGT